jgi:hypothetical protein
MFHGRWEARGTRQVSGSSFDFGGKIKIKKKEIHVPNNDSKY